MDNSIPACVPNVEDFHINDLKKGADYGVIHERLLRVITSCGGIEDAAENMMQGEVIALIELARHMLPLMPPRESLEFDLENLLSLCGELLMDVERLEGEYTSSGADEELQLSFTNGREIIVYKHDDGTVHVEAD